MTGGTRKQKEKKKFSFLECIQKLNVIKKRNWVLVFSFMYLVSVDPMDRSYVSNVYMKFLFQISKKTAFITTVMTSVSEHKA